MDRPAPRVADYFYVFGEDYDGEYQGNALRPNIEGCLQMLPQIPHSDVGPAAVGSFIVSDDETFWEQRNNTREPYHFVMTSGVKERFYGTILTFVEPAPLPNLVEAVFSKALPLAKHRKGRRKTLVMTSSWPFCEAMGEFLKRLVAGVQNNTLQYPVERIVSNFLFQVPVPLPSPRRVLVPSFLIGVEALEPLVLQLPSPTRLATGRLGILFELLSVDAILLVLAGMVLERKVLFMSTRKELLVAVGAAMETLFSPFVWVSAYTPFLPNAFFEQYDPEDVLGLPGGFLFGTVLPYETVGNVKDVVYVHLDRKRDDNNKVTITSDSSPILPLPAVALSEAEKRALNSKVREAYIYKDKGKDKTKAAARAEAQEEVALRLSLINAHLLLAVGATISPPFCGGLLLTELSNKVGQWGPAKSALASKEDAVQFLQLVRKSQHFSVLCHMRDRAQVKERIAGSSNNSTAAHIRLLDNLLHEAQRASPASSLSSPVSFTAGAGEVRDTIAPRPEAPERWASKYFNGRWPMLRASQLPQGQGQGQQEMAGREGGEELDDVEEGAGRDPVELAVQRYEECRLNHYSEILGLLKQHGRILQDMMGAAEYFDCFNRESSIRASSAFGKRRAAKSIVGKATLECLEKMSGTHVFSPDLVHNALEINRTLGSFFAVQIKETKHEFGMLNQNVDAAMVSVMSLQTKRDLFEQRSFDVNQRKKLRAEDEYGDIKMQLDEAVINLKAAVEVYTDRLPKMEADLRAQNHAQVQAFRTSLRDHCDRLLDAARQHTRVLEEVAQALTSNPSSEPKGMDKHMKALLLRQASFPGSSLRQSFSRSHSFRGGGRSRQVSRRREEKEGYSEEFGAREEAKHETDDDATAGGASLAALSLPWQEGQSQPPADAASLGKLHPGSSLASGTSTEQAAHQQALHAAAATHQSIADFESAARLERVTQLKDEGWRRGEFEWARGAAGTAVPRKLWKSLSKVRVGYALYLWEPLGERGGGQGQRQAWQLLEKSNASLQGLDKLLSGLARDFVAFASPTHSDERSVALALAAAGETGPGTTRHSIASGSRLGSPRGGGGNAALPRSKTVSAQAQHPLKTSLKSRKGSGGHIREVLNPCREILQRSQHYPASFASLVQWVEVAADNRSFVFSGMERELLQQRQAIGSTIRMIQKRVQRFGNGGGSRKTSSPRKPSSADALPGSPRLADNTARRMQAQLLQGRHLSYAEVDQRHCWTALLQGVQDFCQAAHEAFVDEAKHDIHLLLAAERIPSTSSISGSMSWLDHFQNIDREPDSFFAGPNKKKTAPGDLVRQLFSGHEFILATDIMYALGWDAPLNDAVRALTCKHSREEIMSSLSWLSDFLLQDSKLSLHPAVRWLEESKPQFRDDQGWEAIKHLVADFNIAVVEIGTAFRYVAETARFCDGIAVPCLETLQRAKSKPGAKLSEHAQAIADESAEQSQVLVRAFQFLSVFVSNWDNGMEDFQQGLEKEIARVEKQHFEVKSRMCKIETELLLSHLQLTSNFGKVSKLQTMQEHLKKHKELKGQQEKIFMGLKEKTEKLHSYQDQGHNHSDRNFFVDTKEKARRARSIQKKVRPLQQQKDKLEKQSQAIDAKLKKSNQEKNYYRDDMVHQLRDLVKNLEKFKKEMYAMAHDLMDQTREGLVKIFQKKFEISNQMNTLLEKCFDEAKEGRKSIDKEMLKLARQFNTQATPSPAVLQQVIDDEHCDPLNSPKQQVGRLETSATMVMDRSQISQKQVSLFRSVTCVPATPKQPEGRMHRMHRKRLELRNLRDELDGLRSKRANEAPAPSRPELIKVLGLVPSGGRDERRQELPLWKRLKHQEEWLLDRRVERIREIAYGGHGCTFAFSITCPTEAQPIGVSAVLYHGQGPGEACCKLTGVQTQLLDRTNAVSGVSPLQGQLAVRVPGKIVFSLDNTTNLNKVKLAFSAEVLPFQPRGADAGSSLRLGVREEAKHETDDDATAGGASLAALSLPWQEGQSQPPADAASLGKLHPGSSLASGTSIEQAHQQALHAAAAIHQSKADFESAARLDREDAREILPEYLPISSMKGLSNREHYDARFTADLQRRGFEVHAIEGDGNCLFRAVSQSLFGSEYMRENFQELAIADVDAYVARMREDREWGGEQEIAALANVVQLPITVERHDDDSLVYEPTSMQEPWASLELLPQRLNQGQEGVILSYHRSPEVASHYQYLSRN